MSPRGGTNKNRGGGGGGQGPAPQISLDSVFLRGAPLLAGDLAPVELEVHHEEVQPVDGQVPRVVGFSGPQRGSPDSLKHHSGATEALFAKRCLPFAA